MDDRELLDELLLTVPDGCDEDPLNAKLCDVIAPCVKLNLPSPSSLLSNGVISGGVGTERKDDFELVDSVPPSVPPDGLGTPSLGFELPAILALPPKRLALSSEESMKEGPWEESSMRPSMCVLGNCREPSEGKGEKWIDIRSCICAFVLIF